MAWMASFVAVFLGAAAGGSPFPLDCLYAADDPAAGLESHPECAVREGGRIRVSETHLARMSYSEEGLASALIDRQWYYLRRDGKSLPVLTYDNGPDFFSEGLTRSLVDGKMAYFDIELRQVIAPKYDWGWPFEDGRALVCLGCKAGAPDGDGHTSITGGKWSYIDKKGAKVGEAKPPG